MTREVGISMSQDQLNDMQPSDHTSDTERANAPTPTLRESIQTRILTFMSANLHIILEDEGDQSAIPRTKFAKDLADQLESLLSDRIREAEKAQTLLLKGAEEKFGKIDWKAALYALEDRQKFSALQEKRNDNE